MVQHLPPGFLHLPSWRVKDYIWVIPVNANQLSNNQHNEMVSFSPFVAQQMHLSTSCNASVWAWLSSCVHTLCVCVCVCVRERERRTRLKYSITYAWCLIFKKKFLVQKPREILVLESMSPLLEYPCYHFAAIWRKHLNSFLKLSPIL
jgi:hypothetical protein